MTRPNRRRRFALVALGSLPFAVAAFDRLDAWPALERGVDALFALQCHRDAARALGGGALLPVCARCAGLYAGVMVAAVTGAPRWRPRLLTAWFLVALTALVLDVATETVALRPASAPLRFVLGLFAAYPAACSALVPATGLGARSRPLFPR